MYESTAETRKCKDCGEEKPLTRENFQTGMYKGVAHFYGRRCRKCISAAKNKRYAANPETYRAKKSEWYVTSTYRERNLAEAKALRELRGAETQLENSLRLRASVLAAGELTCTECGETKSLDNFRCVVRKDSDLPYYDKQCKACVGTRRKIWRDRNPDEVNRKAALWERNNRESINARRRRNGNSGSINRRKRLKSAATFVPITREQIQGLIRKQKGRCAICKKKPRKLHVDHVMPLAKGGAHAIENMQMLCPTCNRKKTDADPIDHMQKLGYLL